MEITETTLQVNRFARRTRHIKIFSRAELFKIHALDAMRYFLAPVGALGMRKFTLTAKTKFFDFLPVAPQKKLLFQAAIVSLTALVLTSVTAGGTFTPVSMAYSTDYISSYALPGDVLVSDESGYLIKINPQTGTSSRIGMTDFAVHTIESGESLSVIATRYGVSVTTLMAENNIANANTIRIGQKLLIPPIDGLSYTVAKGDTLKKIADKYKISTDAIIAQNGLENDVIAKGQELFLPGAKPLAVVNVATAGARASSASRSVNYANISPASSSPSVGKIFIFPTIGKLTQGFRAGHYALDIGDRSMPPIWAAGTGTVVKASSGTWGGGYGTHVIIDHGNGIQTLYAHLSSLNVTEGQLVNQGDVIGIMGNTGRVYGPTGIHLHWEVFKDGVKQNPAKFY